MMSDAQLRRYLQATGFIAKSPRSAEIRLRAIRLLAELVDATGERLIIPDVTIGPDEQFLFTFGESNATGYVEIEVFIGRTELYAENPQVLYCWSSTDSIPNEALARLDPHLEPLKLEAFIRPRCSTDTTYIVSDGEFQFEMPCGDARSLYLHLYL